MQLAADMTQTTMVSVIGIESDKVAELCKAASEKSGKEGRIISASELNSDLNRETEPDLNTDPPTLLGSKIQIANYLCPGNYAVSGSLEAAKVLEEIAKPEFGARMTVRPLSIRPTPRIAGDGQIVRSSGLRT